MDVFYNRKFAHADMLRINRCRLFHRVAMVSDICDGTGTKLLPSLQSTTRVHPSSRYAWPNQGIPTLTDRKFWAQSLRQVLCSGGNTLDTQLGPWNPTDHKQQWGWHLTSDLQLVSFSNGHWKIYPAYRASNTRSLRYHNSPVPFLGNCVVFLKI